MYNFTVNGTSYHSDFTSYGSYNSTFSMYLFALQGQTSGTASNNSSAGTRCYWTKIWQLDGNGDYQPKRNFTPCVKDGKAALFDSVTGMIYYPQGGDLTASENEAPVTSARWIGGAVTSAADLANASSWKCQQGGLVVYGKTPVTVSEGVATLICPVALGDSADWGAAGVITLASGATIDLNGHDLTTGGFAAAEGTTASVLNSGDTATLTFAVADGDTATMDNITFANNIAFAKTGTGALSCSGISVGARTTGSFTLTDGTFSINGGLVVGDNGNGVGTVTQTG